MSYGHRLMAIRDTNGTCRVLRRLFRRGHTAPPEFSIMGSIKDKAAGVADQAIGKAKQAVGKAVGNDRLVVKGAAQEAEGKARKAVGDAKSAVKQGVNKVAGKINHNL
jgi:uncharacterized protein YjbJ (UPF0337 family)